MKEPSVTPADCLPDTASKFLHENVRAGVTIYRDPWGIPHIFSDNAFDAFFAQGFATAQDRLWQMDFDRMRCLGRAAEYLGEPVLEQDILMRRRNFEQVSRADYGICGLAAKRALDSYSAGVNAFIQSDDPLPFEYHLLEGEPEPWEPWHCILVYKVRNSAEGSFQAKLWRSELAARMGPEGAAELSPGYQNGMYLTVPPGATYSGPRQNAVAELRKVVEATAPLREVDGGSNGWAISGALTKSGRPMVGGDSHRMLEVPNVYYQVHLATADFDVLGHSIPGMPLVMHFAHNRYVAWGMTHGGVDTQDLFVEKLRRRGGGVEYLFRGSWREAERREEEIEVRGGGKATIEAVRTHHGPIIAGDVDSGYGITLSDPGSEDPTPWVDATLDAMCCRSADEFETALGRWTDRVNNYPYADVHGNYGYALKGRIPIREEINGWGPVDGWSGDREWRGFIPDEELPRARNPEIGWAVTCNQRVVGDDYPYFLTASFGPDYRASRIIKHIETAKSERRVLVPIDTAAFHGDVASVPAEIVQRAIRRLRSSDDLPWQVADAIRAIVDWDGRLEADSAGALVYSAVNEEIALGLIERCYGIDRDEFASAPDPSAFSHLRGHLKPAFMNALEDGDTGSFLGEGESIGDFLLEAIERAARKLYDRQGGVPVKRWGQAHITRQIHPLSAVFPNQAGLLNAPPVGTGGDVDVPFATGSRPLHGHKTTSGPVNRYLHDPSDWSAGKWIVPLGASGNSASPHFADQQKMWAKVDYIPQLFEREEIENCAESRQELGPIEFHKERGETGER